MPASVTPTNRNNNGNQMMAGRQGDQLFSVGWGNSLGRSPFTQSSSGYKGKREQDTFHDLRLTAKHKVGADYTHSRQHGRNIQTMRYKGDVAKHAYIDGSALRHHPTYLSNVSSKRIPIAEPTSYSGHRLQKCVMIPRDPKELRIRYPTKTHYRTRDVGYGTRGDMIYPSVNIQVSTNKNSQDMLKDIPGLHTMRNKSNQPSLQGKERHRRFSHKTERRVLYDNFRRGTSIICHEPVHFQYYQKYLRRRRRPEQIHCSCLNQSAWIKQSKEEKNTRAMKTQVLYNGITHSSAQAEPVKTWNPSTTVAHGNRGSRNSNARLLMDDVGHRNISANKKKKKEKEEKSEEDEEKEESEDQRDERGNKAERKGKKKKEKKKKNEDDKEQEEEGEVTLEKNEIGQEKGEKEDKTKKKSKKTKGRTEKRERSQSKDLDADTEVKEELEDLAIVERQPLQKLPSVFKTDSLELVKQAQEKRESGDLESLTFKHIDIVERPTIETARQLFGYEHDHSDEADTTINETKGAESLSKHHGEARKSSVYLDVAAKPIAPRQSQIMNSKAMKMTETNPMDMIHLQPLSLCGPYYQNYVSAAKDRDYAQRVREVQDAEARGPSRKPSLPYEDVFGDSLPLGLPPPLRPIPAFPKPGADPIPPHEGIMWPIQFATCPPYTSPGYDSYGVKQPVGVVQADRVPTDLCASYLNGVMVKLPAWVSPLYKPYGIGGPFGPSGPFSVPEEDSYVLKKAEGCAYIPAPLPPPPAKGCVLKRWFDYIRAKQGVISIRGKQLGSSIRVKLVKPISSGSMKPPSPPPETLPAAPTDVKGVTPEEVPPPDEDTPAETTSAAEKQVPPPTDENQLGERIESSVKVWETVSEIKPSRESFAVFPEE